MSGGGIPIACSRGLDDRSVRPMMTGDGRKRGGGMWSLDVKLSRALDLQLPCSFKGVKVAGVELPIARPAEMRMLKYAFSIFRHRINYRSFSI